MADPEHVRNVLDAVEPPGSRRLIVDELARRAPDLLAQLCDAQSPTNDQSEALISAPGDAMSEHWGPDYEPDERGKAIDNAVGHYLLAWPIYR